MTDGRWPMTNDRGRMTDGGFSNHILGHRSWALGHCSWALGHRSWALGHRSWALGHCSSALGHCSSALGHCSSVIGHLTPPTAPTGTAPKDPMSRLCATSFTARPPASFLGKNPANLPVGADDINQESPWVGRTARTESRLGFRTGNGINRHLYMQRCGS